MTNVEYKTDGECRMYSNKPSVNELKRRMKSFALQVVNFVNNLPFGKSPDVLGEQLLRAGTSVGANYLAACRARSRADFISKMKIVEEEADESIYWMELLADAGIVPVEKINYLVKEANELLSITVTSIKTAKQFT